jgi:hypothetical protein
MSAEDAAPTRDNERLESVGPLGLERRGRQFVPRPNGRGY